MNQLKSLSQKVFVAVTLLMLTTNLRAQNENVQNQEMQTFDTYHDVGAQTKLRESLANDPFRPLYHISPPSKGLHDAAGLCFWKGYYHCFYLTFFPHWGRGHAISKDLVHWQDLPPLPDTFLGGTGQALVDSDKVILGFANGRFATASDLFLVDWKMRDDLPLPRGGDNCMWKEDGHYYVGFQTHNYEKGLRYASGRTKLALYRSKDLKKWDNLGFMFEDNSFAEIGEDCACPNFLPLTKDRHLMLYFTHKNSARFYVGDYNKETFRFTPDRYGKMCYGPVKRGSIHAPSAFIDQKGRIVATWNIFENRDIGGFAPTENLLRIRDMKGWQGMLTLPRHLTLNGDKTNMNNHLNPLGIAPIDELKTLRRDMVEVKDMLIPANEETVLPTIKGKAMEIVVEIDPMEAREVGLNVFRSPDGKEQTTVSLFMDGWERNREVRDLMIDVSKSTLDPKVRGRSPEVGPVYIKDGEKIKLRIFIDRSVIEVFANGIQCLTLRVYPSLDNSNGVSIFSRGSDAKLINLKAYQMDSIWPELKHKVGK
jgi:beta-fructofuranosidase